MNVFYGLLTAGNLSTAGCFQSIKERSKISAVPIDIFTIRINDFEKVDFNKAVNIKCNHTVNC